MKLSDLANISGDNTETLMQYYVKAEESRVEITLPFPLLTIRGEVTDISPGDWHNHSSDGTLEEADCD